MLKLYPKMSNVPNLFKLMKNNDLRAVSLAIKNGADVNAKNEERRTPLFLAESLDMMKLLVDAGAKVNIRDDAGETPIFNAVAAGLKDEVEYLISRKANVNLDNDEGQTLLDIVYTYLDTDLLDMLRVLKRGGLKLYHHPDAEYLEDLYNEIREKEDGEMLEWLFKEGYPYNASNIVESSLWELNVYLKMGVNPNTVDKNGLTALSFSAAETNFDTVQRLIEAGADVDLGNPLMTTLYIDRDPGREEIVIALVNAGAKLDRTNEDGETPLIVACRMRWPAKIILLLIAKGSDINKADIGGKTARDYILQDFFK